MNKDLTTQTIDPGTERMKSRAPEYKAAMAKLWAAGLISFGAAWRSDHGEVGEFVFNSWARSLCVSFEPETIAKHGSQILSTWGGAFPPSLGQLRTQLSAVANQTRPGAVPEITDRSGRSRAVMDRELDRIYTMLGSKRPTHEEMEERRNGKTKT